MTTSKKKVKGWLLLKEGTPLEAIPSVRKYAEIYYEHEIEDLGHTLRPCTIEYSVPKRKVK